MGYHSSFQRYNKEKMARAVSTSLPISTKECIEICNALRYKPLARARAILQDVVSLKKPIAYRRFLWDMGHKPGMAAGRYPIKASSFVLILLASAEANAQFKGLHTANLRVAHICAHRASRPVRAGRHRGRLAKRTHLELVLEEKAVKTAPKKDTNTSKNIPETKTAEKKK